MRSRVPHFAALSAVQAIGAIGAIGAIALFAPAARARPRAHLDVETTASEACPAETDLRDAVTARIGYDPFTGESPRIHVRFGRRASTWLATVWIADADGHREGERELSSSAPECKSLLGTTALAIAIVVDPFALSGHEAPAPPPAPPPTPAEPPPPAPPAPPLVVLARPAEPPAAPILWRIGGAAHLSLGSAPSLAFGLALFGEARSRLFSLALEAGGDFPASGSVASGTVTSQILEGAVLPCVHVDPAFFCARGALGALFGSGAGVAVTKNAESIYATVGGRLGVDWSLSHGWALEGYVDLLANLDRVSLDINGQGVWTSPALAGRLGLAIARSIP